jgi:hypothetical protein
MIDKEKLGQLSSRARLAYALVCLDFLYRKLSISRDTPEYKYLVNTLWLFIGVDECRLNYIGIYLELSYDSIVRNPVIDDQTGRWRNFISQTEELMAISLAQKSITDYSYDIPILKGKMDALEKYYVSLPDCICDLFYYMHEIFEYAFDGGGENPDDQYGNTYTFLILIIQILESENVSLPLIDVFESSRRSDNHGFGSPVFKERIGELLGLVI